MLHTLAAYYITNRLGEGGWEAIPVINFDYYYGDTNFDRKYLAILSGVIQRSGCDRVSEKYLPK